SCSFMARCILCIEGSRDELASPHSITSSAARGACQEFPARAPCRLQVDDEVEFARLHDRQFCRLFAFEDTPSIDADLAKVVEARSVTHHPACVGKVAKGKNRRERMARRERQELATAAEEKRVGSNHEPISPLLHNARKGNVDLATGGGGKNVDRPPDG